MANIIGGLIGAGGGLAAYGLGVGKNKSQPKSFGETSQYDPNAAYWGGNALGKQWGAQGLAAQKRQGVQLDNTLGNESRASQYDALGLMKEAAYGNRPSVAQLQMQKGLDQGIRNQQAMTASVRGPQALGMAQYGGAQNTAQLQQGVVADMGALRADEMSKALAQYGGMGTAVRGQDEQRATEQAMLEARQRAMNDAFSLGTYGLQAHANDSSVSAAQRQQELLANSYNQNQQIGAGINAANAANEWNYYKAIMGGIQGGMGASGPQSGGGLGGGGGGGGGEGGGQPGYPGAGVGGGQSAGGGGATGWF